MNNAPTKRHFAQLLPILMLGFAAAFSHAETQDSDLKLLLGAALVDTQNNENPSYSSDLEAHDGALIEYRLTVTNNGASPISDLSAGIPIPQASLFTGECSSPSIATASISDGRQMPLQALLANENPKLLPNTRHLSWKLESLAPSETAVFTARVQHNTVKSPSAAP